MKKSSYGGKGAIDSINSVKPYLGLKDKRQKNSNIHVKKFEKTMFYCFLSSEIETYYSQLVLNRIGATI